MIEQPFSFPIRSGIAIGVMYEHSWVTENPLLAFRVSVSGFLFPTRSDNDFLDKYKLENEAWNGIRIARNCIRKPRSCFRMSPNAVRKPKTCNRMPRKPIRKILTFNGKAPKAHWMPPMSFSD